MPGSSSDQILVINSGSSSVKFGIFDRRDEQESLQLTGSIDSIGQSGGKLKLKGSDGKSIIDKPFSAANQDEAFAAAMQALEGAGISAPVAIGHRIVHGGPRLREHQLLTPEVLATLKQAVHFAPLHDPPAIAILEAAQKHFKDVPQFVCFDTAFHKTIPEVASHYALPVKYWEQGVLRYGFHGLSYESIVHTLGADLAPRTVVAHLGNGASLAAILKGKSIDTSMGLTPTGGVPMGTRSGDLDPGIVLWLLRNGLDADAVESLLNHDSGLKGLSQGEGAPHGESDMRMLTKSAAAGDRSAILAMNVFTRSIAKTIAAYTVSLNGLDALVFTGGIGENSVEVRGDVCAQLAFLGVQLHPSRNGAAEAIISKDNSPVVVRVVETDEDAQIARHTRRLLNRSKS